MFKRICALICMAALAVQSFTVGNAANLQNERLLHENYENGAVLYPSISSTMLIEDGDGINNTKYANSISPTGSQWKTMETWARGVVVYELRARYNGTYQFGFGKLVTRDGGSGETWSRTAEIRISDTSWKYYRIFVDYTTQNVTAFSSDEGFESLEPTALTVNFGRDSGGKYAEGMKMFTVNNLAFDDFSIYETPEPGDWISDVDEGAQNIGVNPQIKISYFSELDQASIGNGNIIFESGSGEKISAVYEYKRTGMSVAPAEALMNDTTYTLKISGVKNTDGEAMDDVALEFKTEAYREAETIKINSAEFLTADGEKTDIDSINGDTKYRFRATNLTGQSVDFTVIVALYRNYGGKIDLMQSYELSQYSLDAESTKEFETVSFNIPEHIRGEYGVRVFFIESETKRPCCGKICYNTVDNKQDTKGDTALLDIAASKYDAKSGAFEISAGKKAAPGRCVTYAVLSEQQEILYIGQELLSQQCGFSGEFHLPVNFRAGQYTLIAKCEDEEPVTKIMRANPSDTVPVCYSGNIDGEVSTGNTVSAKYSVYSTKGDVRVIWEYADDENGDYTKFGEGDSAEITAVQSNKYIRFSLLCGEQVIYSSAGSRVSATEKPDKVKAFLETNFDDGSTYWANAERIISDGVNSTTFARTKPGATAGYVTLTSEANGEIVLQFRAKSIGHGYFTVSTRQDSNYQKTINYTNSNISQISSWGYYRILLDCENGTSKVYYSPSSFMEMTEVAGGAAFSNATGFNMITFQNCCIDDIRILAQPNPGAFTYDISDGAEVVFYSPMNTSSFTASNISLYCADDRQNVTLLSNIGQFGFKVIPALDVIYDRSYRLVMNDGLTLADGMALAGKSFDFSIGEEPEYSLIRITDENLKIDGEDALEVMHGENQVEFNLTNVSGHDIEAVITLALYKNTNGADYMVDFVQKDITVATDAYMQTVQTGSITVPEGNNGDYSLRVFTGTKEEPYNTVARVIELGVNASVTDKNESSYERKYKLTLDEPRVDYDSSIISINGNVHSGKNKRVVVTVKESTGDVIYIGYAKSAYENGSFAVKSIIPPNIADGRCTVEAFAERVSQKAVSDFTIDRTNIKPAALNVKIDGNCAALETVSANYSYYHPLGAEMTGVEYAWYIAETENGVFQKVGSEENYAITEDMSAKYLKCSVKVLCGESMSAEVFSDPVRITPKPTALKLEVKGTKRAGSRIYAAYEYFHADNVAEKNSQIEWYIAESENGAYESIGTGDYIELTAAMVGKYVRFSVTPGSSTGMGEEKTSVPFVVLEKNGTNSSGGGSQGSGGKVGETSISTDIKRNDTPQQSDAEFEDMRNHWAKDIVGVLRSKGVVNGKSATEFAPDESIRRGDFAVLLAKAGGLRADNEYDFKDVDKSSYFYISIAALYENEIMQGYDGYMRPNDPITREEAAAIAVRYIEKLELNFAGGTQVSFSDADSISEWAADKVDSAAQMNVMIGDSEGRFNPQSALTRAECAVIVYRLSGEQAIEDIKYITNSALSEKLGLVDTNGLFTDGYATENDLAGVINQLGGSYAGGAENITLGKTVRVLMELLGYGTIADAAGGYPNGYMKYAERIELLKNVGSANPDSYITPAQLMKLTDNMLLARVYTMNSVGSDNATYSEGDTYLYTNYSILKIEGVLNATERSSVNGTVGAGDGAVEIDDEQYKTAHDCTELLGYCVEAYYNDEDDLIVYAEMSEKKNKEMRIDAREIESISKNRITYTPKGASSSKRENVSDYMPVLVNGFFRGYLNTVDTKSITPQRGSLVLIDNNKDGKYECMLVTKYDLYVADSVNSARHFITFKNSDNGIQFKSDSDDVECTVHMNGEEIGFGEIKEWDVLAVLYSENRDGGKYYDINVIRRTLTGEFTGIDEDYIYIDGKAYDVLDEFSAGQIMTGREYTFLFAGDDDIIWYQDAENYRYGYVVKAGRDDEQDSYFLRLVNDKGISEMIILGDKVKYNGKKTDPEEIYSELLDEDTLRQQMIKYCLDDDNKMKSFYTVQRVYTDTETPDENIFFTKTEKASRYEHINTYGFLYSMASGATTFFINGEEGQLETKNVSIGTMSGTSDSSYMCEFFDVDDIGQAKAAIFYRENSSLSDTVPQACFVDRVYRGTDDDGNSGTFIAYYYYFDGGYNTVFVEDDAKKEKNSGFYEYGSDETINSINDLERGDIVQLAKNVDGNIEAFRVLYDRSANNAYGTLIRSTNDNAPRIEVIYSPVYGIDGSKIKVVGKDGNMRVYDISESAKYFKAYTLNKTDNTLALTDYSNILSVRDTGSEETASKIVMIVQSGYVRCIMIEDNL